MMAKKRFKKFDTDLEEDLKQYEELLNNPQVEILKQETAFDKTRGNKFLIALWWIESDLFAIDS